MKIKTLLLPIIALAIMVALGACSNEELMTDANPDAKPHTGRTLSFTAAMPGEDVATRVGLTQEDDKTITLTWQTDDELQLAFVQEGIKATNIATIASMSADKKKATFMIEIPAEIDLAAVFNLYGVYGAGVIDITNANPFVTLPTYPGNATSLADVQTRKDVMLSFQSLDVDINGEPMSVAFTHLGSLFCITLKNTGSESLDNLQEARIRGLDHFTNDNWAYNADRGGQTYDLVNKTFQNTAFSSNYIIFKSAQNNLPADGVTTFWGWYPPLPNVEWPRLQLNLRIDSPYFLESTNSLPARTSPTAAGKSYYFYAAWDGTELNFTDESFSNELTIHVAEMGTLSTLLSATQKATITKLTVTGQINKADYDVMKSQMPILAYVDLSQVTSYESTTPNKIPDGAFGDAESDLANKTITTIVLPESITAIGDDAFGFCFVYGSLSIPDAVTTIGKSAFFLCHGFTGPLTLPSKLKNLGDNAFAGCFNLTGDLIIPEGVINIGYQAFTDCSGFTGSLALPTKVEAIGDLAFAYCFGFTGNLNIPDNVTTIGEQAFHNCSNFNGALTLPAKLETIGRYAFANCSTLVGYITIPDKVTAIGEHAFDGCRDITSFQFPHTAPIAYTEGMLPDGKTVEVQTIAVAAYKAAEGWHPRHPIVPLYDEYAVDVATKGTLSSLLTPLQKANIRKLTVTGQINEADYEVMRSQMPSLKHVDLSKVISYEGTVKNKIPDSAFGDFNFSQSNRTITTIVLPESTTAIGNQAFRNCYSLTGSLTLPDDVTEIGNFAFSMCQFTGDLVLPEGLITIQNSAFDHSGFNGSLTIPVSVVSIGESAFSDCQFTGNLILPEGLTTIENAAFNRCDKITGTVIFPSKLTSIGTYGFNGCTGVEAFQFPHTTPIVYTEAMLQEGKTVTVPSPAAVTAYQSAWGANADRHTITAAFDGQTVDVSTMGSLSTLLSASDKATISKLKLTGEINKADFDVMRNEMPMLTHIDLSAVTCDDNKIPSYAFGGDNNPNKTIKSIILPHSITSIGVQAFKACTGLTDNLIIPDKVTVIDHDAFFDCVNLSGSLIIPNSVTRIGSNVFRNCKGFDSLTMSQGIETIGWGPFYNCTNLKGTVKFPQSLVVIEGSAFFGCNNIDGFQFHSTTPIPYESQMLPNGKPVKVPAGQVDAYKAKWGSNANRHTITEW